MTLSNRAAQLATAEVLGLMGAMTVVSVVAGWSSAMSLFDAAVMAGIISWIVFRPSRFATGLGILVLAGELVYGVLAHGVTGWLTTYLVVFVIAYSAHAKAAARATASEPAKK
jgi:hypothetical protein